VDGESWPTVLTEVLGQIVCDPLRSGKDQNLPVLVTDLIQVFYEFPALLEITANLNNLLNVMIGRQIHGTNIALDEIF
jgi:hypothetical protein